MPAPNDPTRPEFYVYRLEVEHMPFYVGIGRSKRASDRVRYVRKMIEKDERGETVRWNLSACVVAGLLRAGRKVGVAYAVTGVPRAEALRQERIEIARLLALGEVLANLQHNPRPPKSAAEVVTAALRRLEGAAGQT